MNKSMFYCDDNDKKHESKKTDKCYQSNCYQVILGIGPTGPQGPPGISEISNYADFYAIMPPDNAQTLNMLLC